MSSIYQEIILDHYHSPHNFGELDSADLNAEVSNSSCGDKIYMQAKVKNDRIIVIKFKGVGCAISLASASLLTDFVKGKTIKEALEVTKDNVIESLGGLPKIKYHCSVLAVDALVEAIYDYFSKIGKKIPAGLQKRHEAIKKSKDMLRKAIKYSLQIKKLNL